MFESGSIHCVYFVLSRVLCGECSGEPRIVRVVGTSPKSRTGTHRRGYETSVAFQCGFHWKRTVDTENETHIRGVRYGYVTDRTVWILYGYFCGYVADTLRFDQAASAARASVAFATAAPQKNCAWVRAVRESLEHVHCVPEKRRVRNCGDAGDVKCAGVLRRDGAAGPLAAARDRDRGGRRRAARALAEALRHAPRRRSRRLNDSRGTWLGFIFLFFFESGVLKLVFWVGTC